MHGGVIDFVMARSRGVFSGRLAEVGVKTRVRTTTSEKRSSKNCDTGVLEPS